MPDTIPFLGGPRDGETATANTIGEQSCPQFVEGRLLWHTYAKIGDALVYLGQLPNSRRAISDAVAEKTGQPIPPEPPPPTPDDSPALKRRSEHYPQHFEGRVPRRVRLTETVRPDLPALILDEDYLGMAALAGREYPVWVNSHGAVSAILEGGKQLGLRPGEFEVVEWHEDVAKVEAKQ